MTMDGLEHSTMKIFCDNTSAISISKNSVQHSQTKHINIHHHFIRKLMEDKEIELAYVSTIK